VRLPADLLLGEDLLGDSLGALEVLRVLERVLEDLCVLERVLEVLRDLERVPERLGVLEPLEDLEADLPAGAEALLVVDLLPAVGDLDLVLEAARLGFSTRPDIRTTLK
jgi:hypothetical protein